MTRVTTSPAAQVQSTPQLEQKHYVIVFSSSCSKAGNSPVNRNNYTYLPFLYKNGLHLLCF